nr:uracil-DNA glycosylase family protein [Aureimonas leprariae]
MALVDAPHVAGLNALARRIAAEHGAAPFFDPLGGGAEASILLLLETPGTRIGPARFVSQDNATGTGRNLRRFFGEAGIGRRDVVIWNAVPFIIHAEGARNRAPTRGEAAAGMRWLPPLLDLLPNLKAAVMAGRFAKRCRPELERLRPGLPLFEMPHPSPVYVVTKPTIAPGIVATLREAREAAER